MSDMRACVPVLCVVDSAAVDAVEGSSSGNGLSVRREILVMGEESELRLQGEVAGEQ